MNRTVYVLSCEDGETYHKAEKVYTKEANAVAYLTSQGFRESPRGGVFTKPGSAFVYFIEQFPLLTEE